MADKKLNIFHYILRMLIGIGFGLDSHPIPSHPNSSIDSF